MKNKHQNFKRNLINKEVKNELATAEYDDKKSLELSCTEFDGEFEKGECEENEL